MTLEELEADLPNGLHDAHLWDFSSDAAAGQADFILDVWLGDLHADHTADRERRRRGRLELSGLTYLVVDDADPRYPLSKGLPVQIDPCAADDDPERARQIPPGGFAGRFFVTEWNAFIHFAAVDARLMWTDAN
jgi:hypothetical protein